MAPSDSPDLPEPAGQPRPAENSEPRNSEALNSEDLNSEDLNSEDQNGQAGSDPGQVDAAEATPPGALTHGASSPGSLSFGARSLEAGSLEHGSLVAGSFAADPARGAPDEARSDAQGKAARVRAFRPDLFDGRALTSAQDVAKFLGVSEYTLTWTLYAAPESVRYARFEIPKRTGGMRIIHAPKDNLRAWQERLAPIFTALYEAHPAAHGFVPDRSVASNARVHEGQRYVFNVDLEDFFPSINFGRIRGLFMAAPFGAGPAAAAVLAQICTHRNGLPQGAPTSPVLSNFIAAALDRRLARLARENRARYTRYADDITFSTGGDMFPPALAVYAATAAGALTAAPGEALERAVASAGFQINRKKVRLQTRHQRQSVTGLVVNRTANVTRDRIRRIRAMLHAWERHGLAAAGVEHFMRWRGLARPPDDPARAFRNVVYGELAYVKMVRGADDPVFLKLCARLIDLDPNPSKFVRQMVFGAGDYDVFISHASEDKDAIARPIFEACERRGVKAFFDEAHIGWGDSFTRKINTALGAARTVLVIVSNHSVAKEWPILEINTALAMEVAGEKVVAPLIVGKPDLSRLPLIRGKDWLVWNGDADLVAKRLADVVHGRIDKRPASATAPSPPGARRQDADAATAAISKRSAAEPEPRSKAQPARRISFWDRLLGRRSGSDA